jgi:hypothetical protein
MFLMGGSMKCPHTQFAESALSRAWDAHEMLHPFFLPGLFLKKGLKKGVEKRVEKGLKKGSAVPAGPCLK